MSATDGSLHSRVDELFGSAKVDTGKKGLTHEHHSNDGAAQQAAQ